LTNTSGVATCNDIYGHLIGDQVLRLVARVLKDSVRDSDLVARYGGEELFAVMPGITLAACKEVAERVRRRISDAKLKKRTTGEEIGSVAVSIGIAQFRLAESADALIERCDRGLYQAKSAGRNRTVTESEIEEKVAA
jgi:diguanylate cyclase